MPAKLVSSHTLLMADCRRYTSEGKAVYMTAALGVVHDTTTNTQKFYGGKKVPMTQKADGDQLSFHRDDILCLDISADRKKVVTG